MTLVKCFQCLCGWILFTMQFEVGGGLWLWLTWHDNLTGVQKKKYVVSCLKNARYIICKFYVLI